MREDERADLVSHLSEFRARVLRTIAYVAAGMVVLWILYDPVYELLVGPVRGPLASMDGELTVRALLEGLLVKLQIVLVGGVIVAAPLIFYEAWAFVAPGLTRSERRAVRPLIPVSGMLFLLGVAVGYFMTGPAVKVLLGYIPADTRALLTLNETILFLLKLYVAFGLGFQLPIVIVLLAKIGIVDSRMLIRRWREAVIVIFAMAAIITPTWDPVTMTACALPVVLLYVGTIGAVKLMERRARKAERSDDSLAG